MLGGYLADFEKERPSATFNSIEESLEGATDSICNGIDEEEVSLDNLVFKKNEGLKNTYIAKGEVSGDEISVEFNVRLDNSESEIFFDENSIISSYVGYLMDLGEKIVPEDAERNGESFMPSDWMNSEEKATLNEVQYVDGNILFLCYIEETLLNEYQE